MNLMLQCESLGYTISGDEILRGISTTIAPRRVTAIVGPNGAGKSTLLAALCGQIKRSVGTVALNGKELEKYRFAQLALFRAMMPQDSAIAFDFLVCDIVELGRYPHRLNPSQNEANIANAALSTTAVAHLSNRSFNTLSGGEKSRTQLARAFAQIWESVDSSAGETSQRWLMLDEPTAALDLAHQHAVMQTVRDWAGGQGVGVVVVLHDLNLALRYAHDVIVMNRGELVAQGFPEKVLSPELVSSVWGVDCEVVTTASCRRHLVVS